MVRECSSKNTSISANADCPRDAASRKIYHIAMHASEITKQQALYVSDIQNTLLHIASPVVY